MLFDKKLQIAQFLFFHKRTEYLSKYKYNEKEFNCGIHTRAIFQLSSNLLVYLLSIIVMICVFLKRLFICLYIYASCVEHDFDFMTHKIHKYINTFLDTYCTFSKM